jgi:fructose-1,6-bisphosphatase/inositol monophosphatase family enzyme
MSSPTVPDPDRIVQRLRELQRKVRDAVIQNHERTDAATVKRSSAADTIYGIDVVIEPVLEAYLEEWGRELPMVVVAEGIEPETGRVFPHGAKASDAQVRLIIDPVDGTRGLMYDKRAAWALAGVAPNKGDATRLRDIEVAVMTELPTSKMGWGDVLWAIKGRGAHGVREDLYAKDASYAEHTGLLVHPSKADNIAHGFAMVANFFPGTKQLASKLMEHLVLNLIGQADVTKAMVFEDQYISTGGQFYELIVGHDRFNADLRPAFYKLQGQPEGLCCHPYDCATLLIAEEAGVVITDEAGRPLDGPLDVTTGLSWIGYANATLRQRMEPLVLGFLQDPGRR